MDRRPFHDIKNAIYLLRYLYILQNSIEGEKQATNTRKKTQCPYIYMLTTVRTVDVGEVEKQDGTGAQQEMDGLTVVRWNQSKMVGMCRVGTGQVRDGDEG